MGDRQEAKGLSPIALPYHVIIPTVGFLSHRYVLLSASAVCLVLAQPPIEVAALAWVALAPLLVSLWTACDRRRAFIDGLVFGTVYAFGVTYWVFHSMRVYGGVPVAAAGGATILLALYLGVFTGFFSMAFHYLIRTSAVPALLTAPCLWVALDLLRNYLFTGFPWGFLGYSQYQLLPVIQIADLTGVYGVTFLIVAVNGAVADVVLLGKRRYLLPLFPVAPTLAGIVGLALTIVAVIGYGALRVETGEQQEAAALIRVGVVQGNIEQGLKWNRDSQDMILKKYEVLSRGLTRLSPDLVVWPETSVPFVYGANDPRQKRLEEYLTESSLPLLFGSARLIDGSLRAGSSNVILANSAILLNADARLGGSYDKIRLVPFGEYVPLNLPLGRLVSAVGDFEKGDEYTVLKTEKAPFGVPICYEIIFPNLVRRFVARGARLIVTITNDAWFGRTSAPAQHFVSAVFRAVENRVPVVRAANTGISGFIGKDGRILWKSELFTEATAVRQLSLGTERTFYTRYGDIFAYLCSVISILLLLLRKERPA